MKTIFYLFLATHISNWVAYQIQTQQNSIFMKFKCWSSPKVSRTKILQLTVVCLRLNCALSALSWRIDSGRAQGKTAAAVHLACSYSFNNIPFFCSVTFCDNDIFFSLHREIALQGLYLWNSLIFTTHFDASRHWLAYISWSIKKTSAVWDSLRQVYWGLLFASPGSECSSFWLVHTKNCHDSYVNF